MKSNKREWKKNGKSKQSNLMSDVSTMTEECVLNVSVSTVRKASLDEHIHDVYYGYTQSRVTIDKASLESLYSTFALFFFFFF